MISIINTYRVKAPADAVSRAVEAMVAKVSKDGAPGILSYELFVAGGEQEVIGLFRYADSAAWIEHHELITDWHEFQTMRSTMTLDSIRFLAWIPKEICDWLEQANFDTSIIEECLPISRYVK